ncbi:MAG: hypothetical protein P1Q69_16515 [Candidatus Thorarchaeota archaeon]|nr:hypothetical protein [Candidatus Thorarchaeota archaeon]
MTDNEKRGGRTVYKMLSQDLFMTNIHGDEIGVRQTEQWRSSSRQFTKDSDIIGRISEATVKKGENKLPSLEKSGFMVLRQSMWNAAPNEMSKRFVVKLFSDSGGWLGTIEEMIADEFAMSHAMGEPQLAFAVMTKENEVVTYIREMYRGSVSTEVYGFFLPGPNGTFEVFKIEGKRASAGDDFKVVLLSHDVEVAEIDSNFGDIGGEFIVKIKDEILAENEWFCRILQAFSIAIRYRIEMRERLKKGLNLWKKKGEGPPQHRYELSLLANPRKLTLKREEFEEV